MDPADLGDSHSAMSDAASSKANTSKRRPPGRPSRLCPETITAICAGIRHGMPVEHAAATAGIRPSTFHSWMAIGRDLEETHADRSALTARERTCLELLWAVRRAEADSLERLQAIAVEAATGHRVTKTVVSMTQRLDKDGEPKWCESRRYEITEGPHIGAVLQLLKHRALEFSQWAHKQEAERISREDRQIAERISRNLRAALERQTLAEDDDGGNQAATTRLGPVRTDDDSDYEYAAWMWTLQGGSSDMYDDSAIDTRENPHSP